MNYLFTSESVSEGHPDMPLKAAPFLQSAQNLSVISVPAKSLRLPRTESHRIVSFARKKEHIAFLSTFILQGLTVQ